MGSRIFVSLCKRIAVLVPVIFVYSVIVFSIIGCPPPKERNIEFYQHSKKRKNYQLVLVEDTCNLKINGYMVTFPPKTGPVETS